MPAQLDFVADRTVLPESIALSLALPQIGTVLIGGVGGFVQTMPSYPVQLAIHNLPAALVEVVASDGETWILLGRDVLNAHRLLLDGPGLFVELA